MTGMGEGRRDLAEKRWPLTDAHTHMGTEEEGKERERAGIVSMVCASVPEEARKLFKEKRAYVIPSCGLHPWYAGKYKAGDMAEWMKLCPAVGEIGMDSVWCDVPLTVQEEAFRRQLDLACKWKKPVILHTKGQEKEIAAMIREYPNRYLAHWYSCEDHLDEYLALDCYVSIGPDVWWNPGVRQAARKVPLNRLLIETDGLNSVLWAYEEGRKAVGEKIPEGLAWTKPGRGAEAAIRGILEFVAGLRKFSPEDGEKLFWENLVLGFLRLG